MPRMMGRLAPAPKWLEWMPGSPLSVSPSVASRRSISSRPSSTLTGVVISLPDWPRPLAETLTSAKAVSAAAGATPCAAASPEKAQAARAAQAMAT